MQFQTMVVYVGQVKSLFNLALQEIKISTTGSISNMSSYVEVFSFLPEASFGLRVLSLPASVCLCVCLCVR